jgi:ribosomal protein S18 acetylase RimI-like enzyme
MKWWRFWERKHAVATPGGESPSHGLSHFFGLADSAVSFSGTLPRVRGGPLPEPVLRWIGPDHRVALRSFCFEADAAAVCDFQEETYALNFPDYHFTRGFAQAFRHDLRRATLDGHHGLFVLDERDGGDALLIGFLWLVVCENNWTGERYGYVNNVYIAPSRRGQGLGLELMQQTDEWFRSRGVHRVRLTVTSTNAAAAALYERSGFRITRWEMEKEI